MVRLAVSVLITAALASSALAQDFSTTYEDVLSRDVAAPGGEELFGRAAIKVIGDLFSREELSELFGRDIEELSQRDLEELFDRELELDEALRAREESEGDDASSGGAHPPAEGGPAPTEGGDADGATKPDPTATASAGTPTDTSPATATPTTNGPALPSAPSFFARVIGWFSSLFDPKQAGSGTTPANSTTPASGSDATPSSTPSGSDATPSPTSSTPDPSAVAHAAEVMASGAATLAAGGTPAMGGRSFYEEPIERSLDYADHFDELVERVYEEHYEREPEFDEEYERDDEEEVLERDYDAVAERDFEDWDVDMLRRAFDLVQQLEALD